MTDSGLDSALSNSSLEHLPSDHSIIFCRSLSAMASACFHVAAVPFVAALVLTAFIKSWMAGAQRPSQWFHPGHRHQRTSAPPCRFVSVTEKVEIYGQHSHFIPVVCKYSLNSFCIAFRQFLREYFLNKKEFKCDSGVTVWWLVESSCKLISRDSLVTNVNAF